MSSITLTEGPIEDAWTDWWFLTGLDLVEDDSYKWWYFAPEVEPGTDLDTEYMLIEDSFEYGNVVVSKKFINPELVREHGMLAVGRDTTNKAFTEGIFSFYRRHPKPIELRHPRYGWVAMVHHCARPGCEYQGSWFDEHGPFSHIEAMTERDAVMRLVDEGFTEPAPGALDELQKSW